jgi:hypothetical protein
VIHNSHDTAEDTFCQVWLSAIKANCFILLSEDLQRGQHMHDLAIINPFQRDPGTADFTDWKNREKIPEGEFLSDED